MTEDEPLNLPINTYSQFTHDFKIIKYNKGKKQEDELANIILKLKNYHKDTAPEYFIRDICKELKEVLHYLEEQNQRLDKEIDNDKI